MATESQRRANYKFQREKCKQYTFKFHLVNDADIIEALDAVSNRQGYLKTLIREDLKRGSE